MSEKSVVKLDKAEIRKAIEDGDNAYGRRWLAVRPNGDYSIHWADNNRQWDPWPSDAQIIGIPALNPEGSGEESEDAEDMLKVLDLHERAEALIEAEDIGWAEAAERLAPDDWKANRDNALDWLEEAFLQACNGRGDDLNDPAPWGMLGDIFDDTAEVTEPPFEFEWK